MQITYKTEGDYVKGVKAECSPVEWLLISTGLELMADNSNLSIKDRRLVKKMIISIKDHDNELNNEGVLDKIRAEIEAKCCITVGRENDGAITLHDVFEIIDKYKASPIGAESEG
jgi:hypothetical protein